LDRIDASGMSCPQPVLLAKKALGANPEGIELLVDNQTAVENVSRFARNSGYSVTVETAENNMVLTIRK